MNGAEQLRSPSTAVRLARVAWRSPVAAPLRAQQERRLRVHNDPTRLSRLRWELMVLTTDAFLISFPKAGRTWLRLMLGRALQNHYRIEHPDWLRHIMELDLLPDLDPRVPLVRATHDGYPDWKTPAELKRPGTRYRNSRIVFLARDPRDVAVSLYYEHSRRMSDKKAGRLQKHKAALSALPPGRVAQYKGTVEEFVREDVGGFETILRYFNLWAADRGIPEGFLLVRYEDMHADPAREVGRALRFLGRAEIAADCIAEAVEFAKFDNMRKLEAESALDDARLKPGAKDDENSYKTRKGKAGGFADQLAPETVRTMTERMTSTLDPFFGYPIQTPTTKAG